MRRLSAFGAALIAAAISMPAAAQTGEAGHIVIRSPMAATGQQEERIVIRSSETSAEPEAPPREPPANPPVVAKPAKATVAPAPNADADVFELEDIAPTSWRSRGRGNVRAAPTTAARIIGKLNKDDAITVMGRVIGSEWYAVDFEGKFGFIHTTVARPPTVAVPVSSALAQVASDAPHGAFCLIELPDH